MNFFNKLGFFTSVFLSTLVSPGQAEVKKTYNPSFDCKLAKSEIELYLCHESEEIADYDRILGSVYSKYLKGKSSSEVATLKSEQRQWLKKRDLCLENTQNESDWCLQSEYTERIIAAKGIEALRKYLQKKCGERKDCITLANFEMDQKNWPQAEKIFKVMCDHGSEQISAHACYKVAEILEKSGKPNEALKEMTRLCMIDYSNLDACMASHRLQSAKTLDPLVGTYAASNGNVFIGKMNDQKYFLIMETTWPNGHSCNWKGSAVFKNHQIILDKDTEISGCKLELKRDNDKVQFVSQTDDCDRYCGARGHMDVEFTKVKPTPK